ncbi:MAG: hypothetical protein QME94_10935, partial [Anaerolineae bacterium]|nr:hypothetical protein [Anaerolineae bacterium]
PNRRPAEPAGRLAGGPAAAALALAALEAWLLPEWPLLRQSWRDLWAWRPCAQHLSRRAAAALLALHLVALTAMVRLLHWATWSAPALLLVLVGVRWLAPPRRPALAPALPALNALLPVYLLSGLEAARRAALHLGVQGVGALPVWPALAILLGYTLGYQVYVAWPAPRRRVLSWAPSLLILAGTLAWAAWAYLSLYARGVTGSDPYCYVQMAVDVMRRGSLLHEFPLAGLAQQLQIDVRPALHVGYREPVDALARAATVWPAGHSVLLGLAGRLGGEPAIYLATPLMALASAAVSAWLAMALFSDLGPPLRALAGSLAALIVVTSFEQLRWLLVHMADVSAQLFSSLTVLLAWLAARRGRRGLAATAGLALGLAYWARHTELAMAVPALAILAIGGEGRSNRQRLLDGVAFLAAALLAAVPDLAYHHRLFGSPFHPESEELELYALRAVPATTALLVRWWLAAPELGYLSPFVVGGALALYRRNRGAGLALGLWLVAPWAVQAPYASLRLRDLLPSLPALALLAAYGAVAGLQWLAQRRRTAAVGLTLLLATLLWLRTSGTLSIPRWRSFDNFGYLWATQRHEFAGLSALTEEGAAIGSTLNSGPIDLYGGRQAFRPAEWRPDELRRFLRELWAAGRPVYLLDDGEEMSAVLSSVGEYARLTPVGVLRRIPYFTPDAGSVLRDAQVYRLEPS